ncbi:TonB-dependent receptor plug domain-containing protein [Anaerosinus sp.]
MKRDFLRKRTILAAIACTTFVSLALPSVEAATLDEYTLDNVVVTASKMEQSAFKAPANINVVTREMLEKNHYANLTDVLRDVPGVTIQNYGNGGGNYTSNSIYINGTKNIVVLIDGMRVNTNGSTFSKFNASEVVDMDTIERIEILKGSASTLYGSDASGGVINIITRKVSAGDNKTSLEITGGSFGKEQYSFLNTGRTDDNVYWMLAAQKDISGDFKDGRSNTIQNEVNANDFNFKIGKDFDEDTSLVFTYESYQSDYLRPKNGGLHETKISEGEKDQKRLSILSTNRISEKAVNQISLYQNKNYLNDNYNDPMNVWLMDLETSGISDQVTYTTENHTLVGGFDFYQDKIKNYSSTSYGYTDAWRDRTITNRAFYLQDAWHMNNEWTLTTGIRTDNHSVYGHHNTPSVVLGYEASDNTNYYMSYKEFFISPNQYQLYSSYGSLNLEPETGKTIEFGVNHKFDKTFTGSFNIFKREAENMIGFNSDTYKYYNVGEESARGWDVQLTKQFNDNFSANVGYTHLYIDPENASSNPNRNGYLPRGAWNLGMKYEKDQFDMQLNGRGIIDREGRKGKNIADEFTSFWIWDAAINYQFEDNAKAFIRVNNIFDKFYTDQCYDMDPDGSWYSAPGRNFQVGVQYSF